MHGDTILISKESKAQAAYEYFDQILGTLTQRSNSINLHELDMPRIDLKHLEQRFTEEEVGG
jgi:hypothetical protein